MKGEKFYIAYGDAAALAIKNAFYDGLEKASIVCFRDDFTQGPLPKSFDLNELDTRKEYWNSLADVLYNVADIDAVLDYSIQEMERISKGSLVYLWTGESAYDRLATMWVAALMDQKGCVVYNNQNLGSFQGETVVNLAMLPPEEIASSAQNFELVHPMKISIWKVSWKNLLEATGEYRLLENDQIQTKTMEEMADYLIHYVPTTPMLARDLIGTVLAEDPLPLSDITVEYLLRQLIDLGKVKYKGSLESMMDYEVYQD